MFKNLTQNIFENHYNIRILRNNLNRENVIELKITSSTKYERPHRPS